MISDFRYVVWIFLNKVNLDRLTLKKRECRILEPEDRTMRFPRKSFRDCKGTLAIILGQWDKQ